ncbi:hypothetical protein BOO86_03105 [Mycobacterium sp. CBMA 234]|nr:hypothetical protein [Mycolicibacterium sp. CBMA 234]
MTATSTETFLASMALHVDADRCGTGAEEFRQRQSECDQQDFVHTGMERRRRLTEQRAGGLDIQVHRQVPGSGQCVHLGAHIGQDILRRGQLPPYLLVRHNVRAVRVLGQQRPPPREGRPLIRQYRDLTDAVLCPRNIEVLQQDSPRNTIDGQMVHDGQQTAGGLYPHRTEHQAGGRVESVSCRHDGLVGQHVDGHQAVSRIHRPGLGHRQRPISRSIVIDAQSQHGVVIQQGLQHHQHVGLAGAGGRLHHHRLVELIHRAS